MGGGLRIVDAERSLIFDEQLLEPGMKFSAPQLEAVYAIPGDDVRVSVIVTNTTAQPLKVTGEAVFTGNGQRPIEGVLKPYETEVIELPNGLVNKASIGAVSLRHGGDKGALLAIIHVRDDERGYSEAVNFADPAQGKTTQLHGAGLRLGRVNNEALTPVLAVRNTGKTATIVAARVPYAKQNGETGVIALPRVELGPGELRLLDTANPQFKQSDFATAGLEVEYTGASGSVVAAAKSFSASGNHVFVLPLKDPQGGMSSTGGYPWFINGSSSTVTLIKNVTKDSQQFHLDIVYPGGRWGSNLKTIGAGQTMAFDVRKIRDTQEKGSEGNTIPPDVTAGHIAWSVRGNVNRTLIGRAQTIDIANALSSTYECQCQCPSSFGESRLIPISLIGFVGDTAFLSPQERDVNCFGQPGSWYNVGPYGVTFSSENSSVATINSSGQTTAAAVGSTYFHAAWQTPYWIADPLLGCFNNPGNTDCLSSCVVQNIDFTITHNKSPLGVKPTGVVAGLLGADPPITVAV